MKLGLGTWQLGGADYIDHRPIAWGDIKETEAVDLVLFALENGIRFIDTADSYGNGLSEKRIAKALAISNLPDVHICTKVGNLRTPEGASVQNFTAPYIKEATYKCLDRLKRHKIETLLLHSPPDATDWHAFDISSLEDLKAEGVIDHYGISAKSVYGAQIAIKSGFGSFIEVIYNILDRRAEALLFGLNEIKNYKVIARVPYASGFLRSDQPSFNKDDYRSTLASRDVDWLQASVKNLLWLEDQGGLSETALKYVMENNGVSFVIPGARRVEQLKRTLSVLKMTEISEEIKLKIKQSVPDVPNWWKPS